MTPPPLQDSSSTARAWSWLPTLYFAQGLPNVAVATLSVVMYKNLGVSNADIALYTSWLYLPWVLKPLWSPLVELLGRKRVWIWAMQLVVGAAFAGVALTIPGPDFLRWTLALFWLLAFSSATHDIAADGFYLLALPTHQQAAFVGVRSLCFRLAMISGQGGLVVLAGKLQKANGDFAHSWLIVFALLAGLFAAVGAYHAFILPRPAEDRPTRRGENFFGDAIAVFVAFFRKPRIWAILLVLLFYRFAEAQLLKLVQPFLLDPRTKGGLGLTTDQVGVVYGTLGVSALVLGGLLGGFVISRFGLKRLLWPMVIAMHLPNAVFVLLALKQPENLALIGSAVAIEQFGYGFGFTAYMLYMMWVADGEHRTAHYAICTGFMALGLMLPGLKAGWLQEQVGYLHFFGWVCLCTIPGFLVTALARVPPDFGKKR